MSFLNPKQAVLQSTNPQRHTYLSVTKDDGQPLCGNSEGWGPMSPVRWDFTPCFLDVWVVVVSIWGILGGLAAIYYLYKKRQPEPVKKDWHFYTKLSILGVIVLGTAVQGALQVVQFQGIWFGDFRFWTTIISL